MSVIAGSIIALHIILLAALSLFSLHRLSMVIRWLKYRNVKPPNKGEFRTLPLLTVQIPLYNERFVAKRIIDACAALNYPADKLQIQIVDDSTDDTSDIVAREVEYQRSQGIDIVQVRREKRHGYKAGALKDAMETATGEFIAVFDADFIPPPDILIDNIGYFTDAEVGMLQFRWGHLNRHSSPMTESQAMMLDAHFALEQHVRCSSDKLLNFNGTAGVWRKETIYDSGNWSADTLTEDLDLSYRAQLVGWKMLYVNDVVCPGEIPADMNAFKSQQHRWAKGGTQVLLKLLKKVWKHPLPLRTKLESTFHLSNNLAYLVMLTDTLFLLIPSLIIREYYDLAGKLWMDIALILVASGGHLVYLFFGQVALGRSKTKALLYIPRLMLLGIQLAFNNARAALEAIAGHQSEFVRTPKSGERETQVEQPVLLINNSDEKPEQALDALDASAAYIATVPNSVWVELLAALTYTIVMGWALVNEVWVMVPYMLLLIFGFLSTAVDGMRSRVTPETS